MENGRLSFGKTQGSALNSKKTYTAETAGAVFTTESGYGDYQLDLENLEVSNDTHKVYGVILTTDNGSYGLRHMENIWRGTELSWCTGFTTSVHNCPTDSEHYKKMMGETIKAVTYYTDQGVYEITMDQYVPIKFKSELKAEDAAVASGQTKVSVGTLPSGFSPKYSVEGLENVSVAGGKLTYKAESAEKGDYTLTVQDASGKYADLHTDFTLYTEEMPAAYNGAKKALTAADGFTAEDVKRYVKDIKSVTVNGETYAATGKRAVVIINEDGSLKTDAEPIKDIGTYEMKVASTGYKELSFTYVNQPSEPVKETIKKASQNITNVKTRISVKASALKKKSQSVKLQAKATAGTITYKKLSGNKKIAVSSSGNVTVKKGLKKGTYKVKVRFTAAKTAKYSAKTITKIITIKVK